MAKDKLNPKQAAFVKEYLVDRNGKQAAIRAGYSEKTAEVKASQLLSIIKVKEAVAAGEAKHQERCNVTIDSITAELDESRADARLEKQHGVAVSASMGKAKLHGLLIDKAQISGDVAVNFNTTYEKKPANVR